MMESCCIFILDEKIESPLLGSKLSDLSKGIKREIMHLLEIHPEYVQDLIEKKMDLHRDMKFLIDLAQANWKIVNHLPFSMICKEKQFALQHFKYLDRIGLETIYFGTNMQESSALFSDKEWVKQVFKCCTREYTLFHISICLGEALRRDREIACIVGKVLRSLNCFDDSIRSDREIVLEIVKDNGIALLEADRKFMDDFEILKAAVKNNITLLAHINNLKFVKYWIKKNPFHYRLLSSTMKGNAEIAFIAIKEGDANLNQLPQTVINREIVIEAIKKNPNNFKWATNFLNDQSVFIEIVKHSPSTIQFCDPILKQDKEFILKLIEIDANVMQYIGFPLNDDIDIARESVKQIGCLLQYFTPKIKQNIEIVKIAVNQNAFSIQYSMVQSWEIVLETLQHDGLALQYIHPKFKEQRDLVLVAVRQNGHALKYAPISLQTDKQIVMEAISNGCPFMNIAPIFRSDREVALMALRNGSRAFKYISDSIRNDEEIVKAQSTSTSNWFFSVEGK